MEPIGHVLPFRRFKLALVSATLVLVLLSSLAQVTGPAHARAGPGCAGFDGCVVNHSYPVYQPGKPGLITPMPASYHSDTAVPAPDQQDSPLISDLFIIGFGIIGTALAVGPLALAAIMDIKAARRQ